MSTEKTLVKGEYVKNPKTGRALKVGSRVWINLVKEGILKDISYQDPQIFEEVHQDDSEQDVDVKIQTINRSLPKNQMAVRGRGKYAGKIVKRNKQPSVKEVVHYTARKSAEVMVENHVLNDDEDDMEKELEQLILSEILNGNVQEGCQVNIKKRGAKKQPEQFYTKDQEEEDEEQEEEDEEEEDY